MKYECEEVFGKSLHELNDDEAAAWEFLQEENEKERDKMQAAWMVFGVVSLLGIALAYLVNM
jgi:hypothetical protein